VNVGGTPGVGGRDAEGGSPATGGAFDVSGSAGMAETGGAATDGGAAGEPATGGNPGTGGAAGGADAGQGGSDTDGCPKSSAYVGNSAWQQQLQVKAGADYCGGWREGRTLEQEFAAKAKLHVVEGTYPLPDVAGSYPFALPVCVEFPGGAAAPRFAGAGEITYTQSTFSTDVYHRQEFYQPLEPSWFLVDYSSFTSAVGAEPEALVFDGGGLVGEFKPNTTTHMLELCMSNNCTNALDEVRFDSCNPEDYTPEPSTVTFEGGQVVFDVRLRPLPGGISESPVFIVASGTLDSVEFEQTDYYKLVYSASHHQYLRSFAVLFDEPIDGACGLKVIDLDSLNGPELPRFYTIECDLSNLAERSVTSAVTELP
jgi:hypothetical protein